MCKTFTSIKLMVVECWKDGLHIPEKISYGKLLIALIALRALQNL